MPRRLLPARLHAACICFPALRPLTLALLLAPMASWGQTAGQAAALQDWREANEAVAQFKRGHIDLLKWESINLPKAEPLPEVPPGLKLMAASDAVRAVWGRHPDLKRVQSRLGAEATQRVAEGRLDAIDASLQRRVEDLDELLAVATEARKAWIEAVAARKVLRFREAALTSAEAGSELGRRMVSVGNWSPLQATPFQLASAAARTDLRRAQLAARQAQGTLLKLLSLGGSPMVLGLPDALPELPAAPMKPTDWAERLEALQAHLPGVTATRNRMASLAAFDVYSASHALALITSGEVLPLRRYIAQETVLHYNGMLKSVWDLLGEVGNQAAAEVDAMDAQRDFWLAEADVQWTLQGGAPASLVSLGGGGAVADRAPAH